MQKGMAAAHGMWTNMMLTKLHKITRALLITERISIVDSSIFLDLFAEPLVFQKQGRLSPPILPDSAAVSYLRGLSANVLLVRTICQEI